MVWRISDGRRATRSYCPGRPSHEELDLTGSNDGSIGNILFLRVPNHPNSDTPENARRAWILRVESSTKTHPFSLLDFGIWHIIFMYCTVNCFFFLLTNSRTSNNRLSRTRPPKRTFLRIQALLFRITVLLHCFLHQVQLLLSCPWSYQPIRKQQELKAPRGWQSLRMAPLLLSLRFLSLAIRSLRLDAKCCGKKVSNYKVR